MPSVNFLLDHQKYKKSGWLYKQGGSVKTVKKRFCVLMANELFYFGKEDDEEHKGSIVLRGLVNRSSIAVEVKTVKATLTLKNCIEIPSDKRTYLVWTDSEYLAGEWVAALNDAYMESVEDKSGMGLRVPHREQQHGRVSVEEDEDSVNDHGDDLQLGGNLGGEKEKLSNKQLIELTIDSRDRFDNTSYLYENNCCIHTSLNANVFTVEPLQTSSTSNNTAINTLSKYLVTRKRQHGNRMTLEGAMLTAKAGDSIVLKPGKHYIPSTLLVTQSIYLIGQSDSSNPCEIILLQDASLDSTKPQPCACFSAPFVYCRNIKFVHYRNDDVNNDQFEQQQQASATNTVSQPNVIRGRLESNESVMSMNCCQFLSGQTIMLNCSMEVIYVPQQGGGETLFDCCWVSGNNTCVYFRKCSFVGGRNGLVCSISASSVVENECVFKQQKNHSILVTQQAKVEVRSSCTIHGSICLLHQSSSEISSSTIYSSNISVLDEASLSLHHNTIYLPNLKMITFNQQNSNTTDQQQQLKNKFVHNIFTSTEKITDPVKVSILNQSVPIIDDNQLQTSNNDLSMIYLFQNKNNMKNMLITKTAANTAILVASDYY